MELQTTPPATGALPMERLLYEVKKVIVGQDRLLERMIVALLARGHLLVEGVPGLAKTMAIKTLARAIGGDFKRGLRRLPEPCRVRIPRTPTSLPASPSGGGLEIGDGGPQGGLGVIPGSASDGVR